MPSGAAMRPMYFMWLTPHSLSRLHVAAAERIQRRLIPSVQVLRETLAQKSKSFENIVKIGRTHLQDATPLTLGQEFSGYVAQLDITLDQAVADVPALAELESVHRLLMGRHLERELKSTRVLRDLRRAARVTPQREAEAKR